MRDGVGPFHDFLGLYCCYRSLLDILIIDNQVVTELNFVECKIFLICKKIKK